MNCNKLLLKTTGIFAGILGYSVLSAFSAHAGDDQREKKPNILWFYIEDMNPLLNAYGDSTIQTPNTNRLAENGVVFGNAFVPSPVCSPCRSGIITGTQPTTLGLHHHRSSRGDDKIYLPDSVETLPEIFREQGYYTYNKGKQDYNFEYDVSELYSGTGRNNKEHWRYRNEDQPFFAQIQLYGGKYVHHPNIFKKRQWKADPDKVVKTLAKNYPRHEIIKKHWGWHYDGIKLTDQAIGRVLDELEKDGLLEHTIIFMFSDHGSYMPRDKQFTYQGGLHVPLIISHFGDNDHLPSGTRRNDLVNLIDVSATALSFADIEIPDWFESRDLFAPDREKREYVVSSKDRMDFTIDRVRSVRTRNFHYVRNFMTDRPYMQPQYRDRIKDYMKLMRRMHKQKKLPPIIDWFYDDYRPAEELYDLRKDPDELRNVAGDPKYRRQLEKMRNILYSWIERTNDQGQYLPETDDFARYDRRDQWTGLMKNPEFDRVRIPYHQVPCQVEAEMATSVNGLKYQITTDGDHGFETLVSNSEGGYELYVPGYPNREKGRATAHPYSAGQKVYEIYGATAGDFAEYPIKARSEGKHRLTLRVASEQTSGRILIKNGDETLSELNLPYTGSNRRWETVETTIPLEEGLNTLRFYFQGEGADLVHMNWFRVTRP